MYVSLSNSLGCSGSAGIGRSTSPSTQDTGFDPSEMIAEILSREDEDGDGMISVEESALDSEAFNNMDADGDGLLTEEELANSGPSGPPPPPPFGPPKVDASSVVSRILETEDTDGDGAISAEETGFDSETFRPHRCRWRQAVDG